MGQRTLLLPHLFLVRQSVCRLQVVFSRSEIADEINLQCHPLQFAFLIPYPDIDIANINKESTIVHLIVYNILHQMVLLRLAERKDGISDSHILEIVFGCSANMRTNSSNSALYSMS